MRRVLLALSTVIAAGLLAASLAAAGGYHGVVLNVPNKVPVNYTNCYNDNGPLPCVTPEFSVTDHTPEAATCLVTVEELGGFPVFYATIGAGQTLSGSFTTPYMGPNQKLTLDITCDNSQTVHSQTIYVSGS
jgi:hypothetical protein